MEASHCSATRNLRLLAADFLDALRRFLLAAELAQTGGLLT
jgi:hypothetical protein